MPRGGAITFGDLDGKPYVLRVACCRCDRRGQDTVAKLIERYGRDARLVDWTEVLTGDCPGARMAGLPTISAAPFPDLVKVLASGDGGQSYLGLLQ